MTRPGEDGTRRHFLKLLAAGSLLRPGSAMTAEAGQLDEAEPSAVALGYRKDSTQVDATKFPQHKSAQVCADCRYYQGKAGSEWGPCTIFAGKGAVHSRGWCAAYAAR